MASDGGTLLLSEAYRLLNVTRSLAACFVDHCDFGSIEHRLETLVAQRVIVLAPGCEDLAGRHDLAIHPVSARTRSLEKNPSTPLIPRSFTDSRFQLP